MYEFEKYLLTKKQELLNITFQLDEANIDRQLKEFLKSIIENEFNSIPSNTDIRIINIENIEFVYNNENFKILNVLLPEEITNDMFSKISFNNKILKRPDICLKILYDNNIFYETIESKTTKGNTIPGSSIQQIIPNEWIIFIKHTKTKIHVSIGKYINSINSKIQFPDRSPRPKVSYNKLKEWNLKNRKVLNSKIYYYKDNFINDKYLLIKDWQDYLCNKWLDILINSKFNKKNEPWFNNNIRKFIIKF